MEADDQQDATSAGDGGGRSPAAILAGETGADRGIPTEPVLTWSGGGGGSSARVLAMVLAAGFHEVARTFPSRPVMRITGVEHRAVEG